MVHYQLGRKGWKEGDLFCLAALPLPEGKGNDSYYGPISAEVSVWVPGSIVIDCDGYLVVLAHLERDDLHSSRERFLEALRQCEALNVPCGVSDPFEFMHARDAWHQALAAVREGKGEGRGSVSEFGDVFVPNLLHHLEQSSSLDMQLHPAALQIAAAKNGDELLSCVYAFLMNGRNVSQAARALYMHRNTLEYRMRVINERWGIDFDAMDEDELLRLSLSCRLLMQRGLEE